MPGPAYDTSDIDALVLRAVKYEMTFRHLQALALAGESLIESYKRGGIHAGDIAYSAMGKSWAESLEELRKKYGKNYVTFAADSMRLPEKYTL